MFDVLRSMGLWPEAHYLDQLLFAVLPYVALVTLVLVTIQRYRS